MMLDLSTFSFPWVGWSLLGPYKAGLELRIGGKFPNLKSQSEKNWEVYDF